MKNGNVYVLFNATCRQFSINYIQLIQRNRQGNHIQITFIFVMKMTGDSSSEPELRLLSTKFWFLVFSINT